MTMTISMPRDRWGVFLLPRERQDELVQAQARVDAAMIGEHGEVGPRGWYEARHEMFEKLLAQAVFHRIVEREDPDDAVAQFVKAIDGRRRGAWGTADPVARRELARANLAKVRDGQLRSALEAALAYPDAGEAGLWILAEAALPPSRVERTETAPRDVSPEQVAELARRLHLLAAEGDEEFFRRDRSHDQSPFRASLCELAQDEARAAASIAMEVDNDDLDASLRASEEVSRRCRMAATARDDVDTLAMVEALERLCERMPTGSLASHVYDVRQTRDLLAWLEGQRPTAARNRVLEAVRSAAQNGHAFAIVFFAE